jgi:hypothetical protein
LGQSKPIVDTAAVNRGVVSKTLTIHNGYRNFANATLGEMIFEVAGNFPERKTVRQLPSAATLKIVHKLGANSFLNRLQFLKHCCL